MLFDFEKFSKVASRAFPEGEYSLEDALSVFRYYFQTFEDCTGRAHPPINAKQIARIVRDMPYICEEDKGGRFTEISPDSYFAIIDQHFSTRYRNCDYNINHFFSGRIRELRFYESCY